MTASSVSAGAGGQVQAGGQLESAPHVATSMSTIPLLPPSINLHHCCTAWQLCPPPTQSSLPNRSQTDDLPRNIRFLVDRASFSLIIPSPHSSHFHCVAHCSVHSSPPPPLSVALITQLRCHTRDQTTSLNLRKTSYTSWQTQQRRPAMPLSPSRSRRRLTETTPSPWPSPPLFLTSRPSSLEKTLRTFPSSVNASSTPAVS